MYSETSAASALLIQVGEPDLLSVIVLLLLSNSTLYGVSSL